MTPPHTTGADILLRTLVAGGVDVCFANPGTSEMHIVAALDANPGMRAVLTLFEGVATGAADGYARMAERPAATLLHLGPGLANGLANLHNARRAGTGVVNVVGDHSTAHADLDAPLQSDVDALAGTVSGWMRRTEGELDLSEDVAEAVAARGGHVATLVVPADTSWAEVPVAEPAEVPWAAEDVFLPEPPSEPAVRDAAEALRGARRAGEKAVLLLGGDACRAGGRVAAHRIAAATGATVLVETFPTRHERGGDLPAFRRLAYLPEAAAKQLAGTRHLVLLGARSPITFFGEPGRGGSLVPAGCEVHEVAGPRHGTDGAAMLATALHARAYPEPLVPRPAAPSGPLTLETTAAAIGAALPEAAIVVDESNTSGAGLPAATAGGPRHDWLTLTGGAIGWGLPAATGAAIACPDRPVWCLQADGSAMYTISALWTQARESLDVTTVVFNNAAYAILRVELARTGAVTGGGDRARELFDLDRPRPDFVALATGFGVPAARVETAEALTAALHRAAAEPGPHLVEALVPPLVP